MSGGGVPGSVLVLGGTGEARELAALLVERKVAVVSSLAGRVSRPRLPVGEVRIGGFGGVDGLADYLRETDVRAVVDATHPFARVISGNAAAACAAAGIPLLRLERPGWSAEPGADAWHWVDGHDAAAETAARLGRRPLLTVGRQSLDHFTGPLADALAVVRLVDPPENELPDQWLVLRARGPYTVDGERELMDRHGIDVLVTKDSGGSLTWAKMAVAAELGVPVVAVRRPGPQPGVRVVATAAEAADWAAAI
ncbi:cobalt-precorrin-6A reductase [uncultured Dietzia sp.]|uniref:cobalt-precorrin-6A reductase n=1 Tax=uncultured Dietzia sp. TaxID=395519 RepID=UPI0025FAE541|nr:cobalt-precorrin-6A reductase [uncultured Dietzia sp.]